MAKLHSCYPSSPLTKERKRLINTKKPRRETTEPYSSTRLGGNFPTSVVARKSNTALSHFPMENRSEICTCRHLLACQPIACPTASSLLPSLPLFRAFCAGLSIGCSGRKGVPVSGPFYLCTTSSIVGSGKYLYYCY